MYFKFVTFKLLSFVSGLGSEDEVNLVKTLFDGYNPLIRPVTNLTERVTVCFGLAMIQLINVVSNPLSIPSEHKIYLFIYLGFYVAFNTVQVISQWVVRRAETSTYSWIRFCTVSYRPSVRNYQLSQIGSGI